MIKKRNERLQIMLEPEELRAVEDFRFKYRLPSRAAAVRELMRRGLGGQKRSRRTTVQGRKILTGTANRSGFGPVDKDMVRRDGPV